MNAVRSASRRAAGLTLLALLVFTCGCGERERQDSSASHPLAGLFTPGNTLGASDPTDFPELSNDFGARCMAPTFAPDAGVPTSGTLSIEYRTQSLDGRYAPKNCTAVWIETDDGQYVATLELVAAMQIDGLAYYDQRGCLAKLGPDVVTSATLRDHKKDHVVSWTGTDFNGRVVPDGRYRLLVEVTESDKEPGELYEFLFDKTAAPFKRELGVDGALQALTLGWELAEQGGVVHDDGDLDARQ